MTVVEGRRRPARIRASAVVPRLAAAVCGLSMAVFGIWALGWPASFAAMIDFPPYNEHLLHDVGAFQIGLGVGLLLTLVCSDALTVSLAAFVVAGGLHTLNHGLDLHLGGHHTDAWGLGAFAVLAALGLVIRLRRPFRPATSDTTPP